MTQQEQIEDLAKALESMGRVAAAISRKLKYFSANPDDAYQVVEDDPGVFLDPKRTAKLLGVTTNTLAVWRCKHKGPKWRALNGNSMSGIRYHKDDLDAFLFHGKN